MPMIWSDGKRIEGSSKDLADQLRIYADQADVEFSIKSSWHAHIGERFCEAAGEIERLTKERDAAQANADANYWRWVGVTAENEGLRAALEPFATIGGRIADDAGSVSYTDADAFRAAHTAFQQETTKP